MHLPPGSVLGRYEVIAQIGSGGMGDVYRARDKKLDTVVALKTIKAAYAQDPAAQPRFERERRLSAGLEHAHICRLLDAGRENGIEYLAMEYLEGESLAVRLARGALPVDQAVGYAIEIADALEYAHAHGVIHRDLKPANVFLTATGVKVLDFGLAKQRPAGDGPKRLGDETAPLHATQAGDVIGSAPYMAPERLEGREADIRSDVFAFGLLLYEMLAGRRAFDANSAAGLIAAILSGEPPPLSLEHSKAGDLEWLLRHCVAKNPDARWQAMGDVKAVLKHIAGPGFLKPQPTRVHRAVVPAIALATAVLATTAWTIWTVSRRWQESIPMPPVTFAVYPPRGGSFTPTEGARQSAQLALSPDGRSLAFVATGPDGVSRVWLRTLDSTVARPLEGTEEGAFPFWSPDAKSLGFFADGYLRRIDLGGGPPRLLASAPFGRGGAWSLDGQILFAPNTVGTIQRVTANGGTPVDATRLVKERGDTSHRWPVFLPDGRRFLYYANGAREAYEGLYLASLDSPQTTLVANTHYGGGFLPPNRMLFLANETLVARVLDIDRGEAIGDPVLVAEHVGGTSNFYGAFSVSRNGVIAFASAPVASDVVWMDRDGRTLETASTGRQHVDFRLSPDGRLLAVAEVEASSGQSEIYVLNFERGNRERVTTARGDDVSPVWAPDAQRLVFSSNRLLVHDLFTKETFGTLPEQPLYASRNHKYPTSWSRDGQWIAFHTFSEETRWDVAIVPTTGAVVPKMLLQSQFNERQAQFSPDGAWLAYTSDESKRDEVYVQSFQDRPTRRQVSVDGGDDPHWRADGGELFYVSLDGYVMAMALPQPLPAMRERPRRLFRLRDSSSRPPHSSSYDVSPDGRRFLVRVAKEDARSLPITVVLHASIAVPQ